MSVFSLSGSLFTFLAESVLLGIGLAMDAFSVSMANGLAEPAMKKRKMVGIAAVFGIFQTAMPLIGWVLVHSVVEYFSALEKFIPWAALVLLAYIGGKMLIEGLFGKEEDAKPALGLYSLFIQGIATSIDALSVGFTIAKLGFFEALTETIIIGAVTFALCVLGLYIGKKFGTKLDKKAAILGGVILILIGIWIFLKGTVLKGIL